MTSAHLQFTTWSSVHLARASRFKPVIFGFSSFPFQSIPCKIQTLSAPAPVWPPNNIQNAQGLGRSALASSGIYLHGSEGSAKLILKIIERFLKPLQRQYSNYMTIYINDHQSQSISSTYDTTSDMMQNHWLLSYCCKYKFNMNIQTFSGKPIFFAPSFSLTWFQMSAHLQCLIQCLHCPSKELCVDVLASNESLDKSKLISADGFPKLCYWTIGWCRNKSADPSRRDMEISYAGSKRCKVILIQTQNPRSKLQNPNGAVWGRHKKNED